MLGIPNYEPNFFYKTDIFIKVFREELTKIIGLSLEDYWFMWETRENRWFNDGPIILKFNNNQFEFTAHKLDELSLTINQIDLNKKLNWYGLVEEFPLIWKSKPKFEINKLIGRKILHVNLIAYNFVSTVIQDTINSENIGKEVESGFMLHGIEFEFEKKGICDNNNFLGLFNALDSNGFTTKKFKNNKQFKKIRIK